MITLDIGTTAKLTAPFITLIGGVLIKYFTEGRPRIVSFIGHISAFTLQDEQKTNVFTHSIIVRNTGTKAAKNVRLGHNIFPQNITMFPSVQYSVETNQCAGRNNNPAQFGHPLDNGFRGDDPIDSHWIQDGIKDYFSGVYGNPTYLNPILGAINEAGSLGHAISVYITCPTCR
ncbi:MAG: hypothetical protein L0Y38_01675 [Methylococcaceae bacterium]|nr:hypothetical protein [Methylococcaceae bacterium]MCI0732515.1 hypothetical protein [Methylococcaceae bacterium]